MSDLISRQAAIDAICEAFCYAYCDNCEKELDEDLCGDCHRKYQNWSASRKTVEKVINSLPSAQPERLTDDDFETIRIHLNAYKETLCNQQRWKEAEEYQRIIDRFMAFASAQPDLSEEDWQLIKRLRSYHNGSYAKVIDKLIAPRVADAVDTGREEGGE